MEAADAEQPDAVVADLLRRRAQLGGSQESAAVDVEFDLPLSGESAADSLFEHELLEQARRRRRAMEQEVDLEWAVDWEAMGEEEEGEEGAGEEEEEEGGDGSDEGGDEGWALGGVMLNDEWLADLAGADGNGGGKTEQHPQGCPRGKQKGQGAVDLAQAADPVQGRKFGTAGVYKGADFKPVVVSDATHYAYRSPKLYAFNAVEFDLLFEVERVGEDGLEELKEKEAAGYALLLHIPLHLVAPLHSTAPLASLDRPLL